MRRALRRFGGGVAGLVSAFRPEPGTTEGAVMLGLLMVAVGLVIADLLPLALIVPGTVIAAIGALPVVRRPR